MEEAAKSGEADAAIMSDESEDKPNAATLVKRRQDTNTDSFYCTSS